MEPKITVLLPVYNAKEEELRQAIESILSQTFSDFEFVIINDGSTNNSEEVILSYNDDRIVYVKNEANLKLIETLNKGLKLARGEYIARIDADDYSHPERLEKQYNFMRLNDDIGLLGTYVTVVPDNIKRTYPTLPEDIKIILRYCINCLVHSSVMIRKSVLEEYNLEYNKHCVCAEDYKLWCDISEYSKISVLPEYLHYYRINPDGISKQNSAWQRKLSIIIRLHNMITDFSDNKDYMFSLLSKFVKNLRINDDEYREIVKLLRHTTDFAVLNVTPPHQNMVRETLVSIFKQQ